MFSKNQLYVNTIILIMYNLPLRDLRTIALHLLNSSHTIPRKISARKIPRRQYKINWVISDPVENSPSESSCKLAV